MPALVERGLLRLSFALSVDVLMLGRRRILMITGIMESKDLTRNADLTRHGDGTGALRTRRPQYVDLMPPCNDACPDGENIQAWLDKAQAGDFEGAWRELVVNNPMPSIHGRVCYHPCE